MSEKGSVTKTLLILWLIVVAVFYYLPHLSQWVKRMQLPGDSGVSAVSSFQTGSGINITSNVGGSSTMSIMPGNYSDVSQNGMSIRVDYTGPKPVVYLNGEKIWKGDSGKSYVLTSESDRKGVVIKIDGKQIWPEK